MIADLVIILALLLGVYVGLSRGLIGPLLTEGAVLIAIFATAHLHSNFDGFLPAGGLKTAFAVLMTIAIAVALRLLARPLVTIWYMLPPLRAVDAPAGAVVHTFAVFVLIYLGLGSVIDFDRGAYPLLKAAVATANAIDNYRKAVREQPVAKSLVDDQRLKRLQQQAGPDPLPMQQVQQAEGFLNFYDHNIRSPLLSSRTAPVINRIGGRLPIVGRPRAYLTGAQTAMRFATGVA